MEDKFGRKRIRAGRKMGRGVNRGGKVSPLCFFEVIEMLKLMTSLIDAKLQRGGVLKALLNIFFFF